MMLGATDSVWIDKRWTLVDHSLSVFMLTVAYWLEQKAEQDG